ncbi:10870_t:CDS:2 [Acaulospora colombiana]|uniref:10870_t:CDS:1 n=1 Tax=Acaulospora colombiana TaxID=27376 RepID=A0ACA9JYJ5_9GLOM|nr:10870_t:CDS:2 [Acaulospora colombiana]
MSSNSKTRIEIIDLRGRESRWRNLEYLGQTDLAERMTEAVLRVR